VSLLRAGGGAPARYRRGQTARARRRRITATGIADGGRWHDVRPPGRRGRAWGYGERGPGRGRRRRPGEGILAFLLYLERQLGRHRGRRQLSYDDIRSDLKASPNDVREWAQLLRRAHVLRPYNRDAWQVVDRMTGQPVPVATIPPWQHRPPDLRPNRPVTIWFPLERLLEAKGQARRGPAALAFWLRAVRDQLGRMLDALEKCKDRSSFYRTTRSRSSAERPRPRFSELAGHGPPGEQAPALAPRRPELSHSPTSPPPARLAAEPRRLSSLASWSQLTLELETRRNVRHSP